MSDEIDDVKDVIKERLRSPFYGSWAIAFVIINWKAFYTALFPASDYSFTDRLDLIGAYYEDTWRQILMIYGLPLLCAVIAVTVIPYVIMVLDGPRYRASVVMDNRRKKSDELRKEQKQEISRLNALVKDREQEIEDQKLKVKQAENRERDASVGVADLQSKWRKEERYHIVRLIHALSAIGTSRSALEVTGLTKLSTMPINVSELLAKLELIEMKGISNYLVTPLGKKVLEVWKTP